jgi:hypothetical protein
VEGKSFIVDFMAGKVCVEKSIGDEQTVVGKVRR